MIGRLAIVAALAAATPAIAAPGEIAIALDTSAGRIVVTVDTARAPITAGNFLRYVDARRFDGTTFYRAARSRLHPGVGLIQGGIDMKVRNSFLPIRHEPTSRTGLHHLDGTISMARNAPGSAMGDFFICVGPAQGLDARPGNPGYAAFGRVTGGMDVVRRILARPTYPGGFSTTTIGQTIRDRVTIVRARRLH